MIYNYSMYSFLLKEGLQNINTNIPLRSSNLFQIAQFQEVLIPKSIIPKTESPKYNGFYIEAGAGDGEIISNSLYFEINYKVIYNNNNLTDAPQNE